MPPRALTVHEAIESVGYDVTTTGCHEWRGKRTAGGYALYNNRRVGRWLLIVEGELDGDQRALHACDNPPCVRREHLYAGTPAQNSADMVHRGRHHLHGRTTCDQGHDLTAPGAVKEYVDGSRCVVCRRARAARHDELRRSPTQDGPAAPAR